ncbi:HIT domain-containing protein [Patescibacteria group bacterium]|nr:HIT domain-containing protein [Patescibacteria group bacterium]MBU1931260.1 HIT domain-containing protein [Patescibacteria group bacterium]
MSDCIFCKIVAGEIPSFKIYENQDYLAFLDIFPFSWGHTLVIPKKHYPWVWEVKNIGEYFQVCQKIAQHYQKTLNQKLVISHVYGEDIPHAHIHLIPNVKNYMGKLNERLGDLRQSQLQPEQAKKILEKLRLS